MPLPVSKKKVGLGRAIFNKRARDAREAWESGKHTTDVTPQSQKLYSVTQETDLDEFLNTAQLAATDFTAEKQNVRIIHAPTSVNQNPFLLSSAEEKETLRKHWERRFELRVPRRPSWTKSMTAAQLDRQEKEAILDWRRNLATLQDKENLILTPFERNLEVWRQLWRVMERSHLVVQIVDARNPLRFRCEDLESYVRDVEGPEGEKGTGAGLRKCLLLINKSDLLTPEQRRQWADYFDSQGISFAFFSALDAKILQEMRQVALEQEAALEAAQAFAKARAEHPDEETEEDAEGSEAEEELPESMAKLKVQSQSNEQPGSEEELEGSEEESSDEEEDKYIPNARNENEDIRTRVLSVLELEDLFIRSAPDLSRFADAQGNQPPKLVVGLVGYPNVGKSSTINALLGEKKVSVSSTPGHTKHFQTIHLSNSIMLCDCPGLVFPQFATTKAELICDGVLPIDQMREYSAPVALVVQRVPADILEATYGLTIPRKTVEEGGDGKGVTEWSFMGAYAIARGFARSSVGNPDEARASRYILKDYVNGKLLYCHPPPEISADDFNRTSNERTLTRLLVSKRKKAPITRVTKMADTFIPVDEPRSPTSGASSPSTIGSESQSARSRAVDNRFFESQIALASRPFIQGGTRHGMQIARNRAFPHQNAVADDGTAIDRRSARVATLLHQAGNDVISGKKHHKPKKQKLRKQAATVGYD